MRTMYAQYTSLQYTMCILFCLCVYHSLCVYYSLYGASSVDLTQSARFSNPKHQSRRRRRFQSVYSSQSVRSFEQKVKKIKSDFLRLQTKEGTLLCLFCQSIKSVNNCGTTCISCSAELFVLFDLLQTIVELFVLILQQTIVELCVLILLQTFVELCVQILPTTDFFCPTIFRPRSCDLIFSIKTGN